MFLGDRLRDVRHAAQIVVCCLAHKIPTSPVTFAMHFLQMYLPHSGLAHLKKAVRFRGAQTGWRTAGASFSACISNMHLSNASNSHRPCRCPCWFWCWILDLHSDLLVFVWQIWRMLIFVTSHLDLLKKHVTKRQLQMVLTLDPLSIEMTKNPKDSRLPNVFWRDRWPSYKTSDVCALKTR